MSSVAFVTLGCKVNQFETEVMEGLFKEAGYEILPHEAKADIYVINTCSVTSLGDKKSRQLIRRVQRQNPEAIIAVTGCYAQIAPEQIKAIEGVRVVLGTANRSRIVEYVEQAIAGNGRIIDGVTDIMKVREFEDIPILDMPTRTRAFLKIQEGCTNFCSYCIIPYTRGPLRSRPLDSIRREAEKLLANGFKEIVFTGIHLGAYGRDFKDGTDLADAARAVLDLPGLRRLRVGSLESIELSPELLELLREHPRFSHHLHLPLQAGSDYVLEKMNRHYNRKEFAQLLAQVRQAVPGVAVSTDIIVGFPGETEEMFAESLEYIRSLRFARMHVFPYSPRPGTPLYNSKLKIEERVRDQRAAELRKLSDRQSRQYLERQLGKNVEIIAEKNGEGTTGNYLKAKIITPNEIKEGGLYRGKITSIFPLEVSVG